MISIFQMETDANVETSKDEKTGDKEYPKVIIPKDPSLYPGFPNTEGRDMHKKVLCIR